MKPNQLATLVLRLMGVYCLVLLIPIAELLNYMVYFAQSGSGEGRTSIVIITLLLTVSWLGVGVSLIVFSKPLGEKLTPPRASEENVTIVSFGQIQILAFAVAGVLIFAEALPQVVGYIFSFINHLIQLKQNNPYREGGWPYSRFGLFAGIGTLLKAALGLWLFFGARGFVNFWRSLRDFGTAKPSSE